MFSYGCFASSLVFQEHVTSSVILRHVLGLPVLVGVFVGTLPPEVGLQPRQPTNAGPPQKWEESSQGVYPNKEISNKLLTSSIKPGSVLHSSPDRLLTSSGTYIALAPLLLKQICYNSLTLFLCPQLLLPSTHLLFCGLPGFLPPLHQAACLPLSISVSRPAPLPPDSQLQVKKLGSIISLIRL